MEQKQYDSLVAAMEELNEMKVLSLALDLVDAEVSAYAIFEGLLEGIRAVDRRYELGEYFIADLIMAGHIMKAVMDHVLVFQGFEEYSSFGRVLIATVRGDIHELGKQVVVELLKHNGFEVSDLGTDVPAARVAEGVRTYKPNILILSGMLDQSADSMRECIRTLDAAGLRQGLRIVVGGAAVGRQDAAAFGADACSRTVMDCLELCHAFMALAAGER